MIELKEHNLRPYRELCEMLEKHDKCAYISATGTGKSYVVAKYIEEHGLEEKTLVLVPSDAIRESWKTLLPGVRIQSYQSLLNKKVSLEGYCLVICDELHHLGAKKWGAHYQELISGYTGKVIGTSATPIRFLDKCRDMTQELFGGNKIYGLELPEAIEKGILPSFDYITAIYNRPGYKEERFLNAVTDKLYNQLDMIRSKNSFQKILKQHIPEGNQKTVVFVKAINEIPEIEKLCSDVFPKAVHFVAHSNLRSTENRKAIQSFECCPQMCFLYVVDILNEGVHIKGVNQVIMFRKTQSLIVYLQQLGRALTADSSQDRIKVFDFVANHSNLKKSISDGKTVVEWIQNGIGSANRQIVVSDYAMEELEVLKKIKDYLAARWTPEEDALICKLYNGGAGVPKLKELMPERTVDAIMRHACDLGVATGITMERQQLLEDIKKYYRLPDGKQILLDKHPDVTWTRIKAIASEQKVTKKPLTAWTEEEERILKENTDLTVTEITKLLPGRSYASINGKKADMGLVIKTRCHQWTEAEDKILRENANLMPKEIKEHFLPERSLDSIRGRRSKLGLGKKYKWNEKTEKLFAELYTSGGTAAVKANKKFSDLSSSQIHDRAKNRNLRSPKWIFKDADEETKELFAELYTSGGSAAVKANKKFSELSSQQIRDIAGKRKLRSPLSISKKVKVKQGERK